MITRLETTVTYLLLSFFACVCSLTAQDNRKNVWEKTNFLWNFDIISSCDVGLKVSPISYFEKEYSFNKNNYKDIKSGDVVWTRCKFLYQFTKEVLPYVSNPFVLIISDGDESFPTDIKEKDFSVEKLVDNPNIIHIFAQNFDYHGSSQKISPLPIGMDFHTIAYKSPQGGWGETGSPLEQEGLLKTILTTLKPTEFRKKRAFVDFQLSDTMHGEFNRYLQFGEDRTSIFKRLLPTGLIEFSGFMRRSKLWKTKGEYAFSISPHGNGLDSHRTWEDLVLGCIVIVKTSILDSLYDGLPVVIVKDWNEITDEKLTLWLKQYKGAFSNPSFRKKLTNQFWLKKIQEKAKPFKNTPPQST